jgi:hypothetical protein
MLLCARDEKSDILNDARVHSKTWQVESQSPTFVHTETPHSRISIMEDRRDNNNNNNNNNNSNNNNNDADDTGFDNIFGEADDIGDVEHAILAASASAPLMRVGTTPTTLLVPVVTTPAPLLVPSSASGGETRAGTKRGRSLTRSDDQHHRNARYAQRVRDNNKLKHANLLCAFDALVEFRMLHDAVLAAKPHVDDSDDPYRCASVAMLK